MTNSEFSERFGALVTEMLIDTKQPIHELADEMLADLIAAHVVVSGRPTTAALLRLTADALDGANG